MSLALLVRPLPLVVEVLAKTASIVFRITTSSVIFSLFLARRLLWKREIVDCCVARHCRLQVLMRLLPDLLDFPSSSSMSSSMGQAGDTRARALSKAVTLTRFFARGLFPATGRDLILMNFHAGGQFGERAHALGPISNALAAGQVGLAP